MNLQFGRTKSDLLAPHRATVIMNVNHAKYASCIKPANYINAYRCSDGKSFIKDREAPKFVDVLNFPSKPSYIKSIEEFREVMRSDYFRCPQELDAVPKELTAEMVDTLGFAKTLKEMMDYLRKQVIIIGLIPYLVQHDEKALLASLPKPAIIYLWNKLNKFNMEAIRKLKQKHARASILHGNKVIASAKTIYYEGLTAESRGLLKHLMGGSSSSASLHGSSKETKTAVGKRIDGKMVQFVFDVSNSHCLHKYAANNRSLATKFSKKLENSLEVLCTLMVEKMQFNVDEEKRKVQKLCEEYGSAKIIEELQGILEKQEFRDIKKIIRIQAMLDRAKARNASHRIKLNEDNAQVVRVSEAKMKADFAMKQESLDDLAKTMHKMNVNYNELVAQNLKEESVLRSKNRILREKVVVILERLDKNMIEKEEELESASKAEDKVMSKYIELRQSIHEQENKYLKCISEMKQFGIKESDLGISFPTWRPSDSAGKPVYTGDSGSKIGSPDWSTANEVSSLG